MLKALARLIVDGVPVRLDRLALERSDATLDLANLPPGDGSTPHSPTTWMVNGSRARPIAQPEPKRLGQGPALPEPDLPKPAHRNGSTNGHLTNGPPSNGKVKVMTPPVPPTTSPTPSRPSTAGPSDDRVLESFQETMRTFLEVQRSTMLAYLAGRSNPAPAPPAASTAPLNPLPEPIAARMTPRPVPARPRPEPVVPPVVEMPKPTPEAPSVATDTRDAIAATLVEIVRDRTGYPSEMLGLELDLEADLGIDSIKRVEILGTLRDTVPTLGRSTDSSTMDALSRARTLGAIVDRVVEIARKHEGSTATITPEIAPRPVVAQPGPDPVSPVRRMVLEVVPAPMPEERTGLVPGGLVVVTDDGRGVARAVAEELESAGHPVVLAGPVEVDFSSPSSVEGLLDLARSSGDLTAIVHALPLRSATPSGLDPSLWASRMGPEVKGLFLLAGAAGADLDRAARRGGAALVAATSMGGSFAVGSPGLDFFPGHGGVSGLVKTLAREWEGVRTRVVDLDPSSRPSRVLASRLVGRGPNRRWVVGGWLSRATVESDSRACARATRSTSPRPLESN